MNKVIKLNRALCGLKDGAKTWNKLLFQGLRCLGAKELNSSPFVFVKKNLFVICHVEELLIYAENEAITNDFKMYLQKRFQVKDLGRPHAFLESKFIWIKELSQSNRLR